ncbi:MAG TPA: ABC transporter permease [Candidatus Acidoferrum sp.]|nr:ABC transporter permease [Candidatus Acidoferrum sp.]
MNLSQAFSMAVKSIRNNKGRSFLTMLGIIIGVSAVITMVTLVGGIEKQFIESFSTMGTNTINISYSFWTDQRKDLSREIYEKCQSMTDTIMGVTPNQQTWTKIKYRQKSLDCRVVLGSDQYDICANYTLERGSMFSYNNVLSRSNVCVVGSYITDQVFNYENPIGKELKINGESYTVVGVFKEKAGNSQYGADNIVLVPYTQNRTLMNNQPITEFSVRAIDANAASKATEELRTFMTAKVPQKNGYSWVDSMQETMDFFNEQIVIMQLAAGGIAGISLLVGGIGIMNIMLVSVTERTREIGIRKAIGARRLDIISQFLIESGTISLMGGIIGIALGSLLSLILGRLMFPTFVLLPKVFVVIGAALFSIAIGMFFGFYPANRASKLNPIDALRSE